ncbi:MAG: hypothetical protein DI536_10685 [Archangium gephyra]|uniref:Calcineurin-like phosphoesterase domain-containing protein n=1 Tax=Archangium gephyra TaxID=48 RepID=A0A2W5VV86_9BACT|nr:MAG: hypothetical protein DI536_10685 [Archangium gephyra]
MLRLSLLAVVIAVCASACGKPPVQPETPDSGTGGGTGTTTGGGTGGDDAGTGGGGSLATGGGTTATGGGSATTGGGTGTTGGGSATTGGGTGTTGGGSAMTGGGTGTVDAGVPAVRFIAIGDTGKGNTGQNQVGQAIGTFCAANGCDFVVMLGDNFYPSGVSSTTDPQWQTAFVQPYATVNAPFYAVLGNHDYGGDGAGTEIQKGDNQVAYSAVNPKWRMPSHHYKWQVGDVEFFAADTNRSMFGIDQNVKRDFDTWLPNSTALWKIVFAHHPYKSNGPHGNAGSYDDLPFVPIANGNGVKDFVEDRVCGRADFYITGHDHNIQWLQATCTRNGSTLNTGLILSGGAASTTALERNQPNYYQSDALGFVYIVIQGRSFTATFFDGDGVQKFTRTVTK